MIIVYTTCKDKKEASKIARELLKKRLIACSNIFSVNSIYWWEGKIERDKEAVLLLKSESKKYKKICQAIKKLHSYKVPAIIKVNADAEKAYLNWMRKEIK